MRVRRVRRVERRGDPALRPHRRARRQPSLVTSSTRGTRVRSSSAAVSPAIPEPTTIASACAVQPGAGAARARARRGPAGGAVTRGPTRAHRPARRTACERQPAGLQAVPVGHLPGSSPSSTIRFCASTKTTCGTYVRASCVGQHAVGDEDDDVAGVHEVRGGAVDADLARARLAGDHVGRQAGAVGHVDHVDLLAGEQVGGVEQVGVDRDRPDVVQVRLRDGGAVDLADHHRPLQRCGAVVTQGARLMATSVADRRPGCRSVGWCPRVPPRAAAPRREKSSVTVVDGRRVDEREVVDIDAGGLVAAFAGGVDRTAPAPPPAAACAREPQRPRQRQGRAALVVGQVRVARRQREAVRARAPIGTPRDLDGDVQVARPCGGPRASCWASFSPNSGDVGPGQVHQLEHHGQHAVEVAGAGRALEHVADRARR